MFFTDKMIVYNEALLQLLQHGFGKSRPGRTKSGRSGPCWHPFVRCLISFSLYQYLVSKFKLSQQVGLNKKRIIQSWLAWQASAAEKKTTYFWFLKTTCGSEIITFVRFHSHQRNVIFLMRGHDFVCKQNTKPTFSGSVILMVLMYSAALCTACFALGLVCKQAAADAWFSRVFGCLLQRNILAQFTKPFLQHLQQCSYQVDIICTGSLDSKRDNEISIYRVF